jgi:hypothetical protein
MKQGLRNLVAAASLVVLGNSVVASQANAFALRVPQINVLGGSLQGYLNSQGESINVLTDQQNAQIFAQSASGNALLTLKIELTGNAAANTIGVYNASNPTPPLYQVFPGAATAGWFAVMSFRTAPVRLVVNIFDASAALVGTNTYLGIDPNNFGFYIQNGASGIILYSQDGRNPGQSAQMLAYQGTGINAGEWWLCFEDTPVNGANASALASAATVVSDQDFDDAVCILESVNPLATVPSTLGSVKGLYRNK